MVLYKNMLCVKGIKYCLLILDETGLSNPEESLCLNAFYSGKTATNQPVFIFITTFCLKKVTNYYVLLISLI